MFSHYYGTPKDKIVEALDAGKVTILEIDVQGGKQAKEVFDDAVMIFILPPTEKDLAERMSLRGRDAEDAAEERLNGASAEIAAACKQRGQQSVERIAGGMSNGQPVGNQGELEAVIEQGDHRWGQRLQVERQAGGEQHRSQCAIAGAVPEPPHCRF